MAKMNLADKVNKEFPEFSAEVSSLSSSDLNARLAQLAKDLEANEDAKEADDALQTAKAGVKEMGAPYRELKQASRLKSRFIISILKESAND